MSPDAHTPRIRIMRSLTVVFAGLLLVPTPSVSADGGGGADGVDCWDVASGDLERVCYDVNGLPTLSFAWEELKLGMVLRVGLPDPLVAVDHDSEQQECVFGQNLRIVTPVTGLPDLITGRAGRGVTIDNQLVNGVCVTVVVDFWGAPVPVDPAPARAFGQEGVTKSAQASVEGRWPSWFIDRSFSQNTYTTVEASGTEASVSDYNDGWSNAICGTSLFVLGICIPWWSRHDSDSPGTPVYHDNLGIYTKIENLASVCWNVASCAVTLAAWAAGAVPRFATVRTIVETTTAGATYCDVRINDAIWALKKYSTYCTGDGWLEDVASLASDLPNPLDDMDPE